MRVINEQDVFDIIDDLRDRMTVEGYWSMVERVKALPSATCGNLEKPEIPQHSEGEAADCNLDCISRQAVIRVASGYCHPANIAKELAKLPSAQPDIVACGDCKHWICHDRRCGYWNHGVKPLDWCCHAERRTDERSD